METKNADKLVKSFFTEYKQEIPDNGFTQRVMRKLPEQADHGWIVWIFAAIGMSVSLYAGLNAGFFQQIISIFDKIPLYYSLGAIFCFPIIGTMIYYATQNKRYQII